MAKTKKGITQSAPNTSADPGSVDAFMARLFSDPTTRAMNPNLRVVNGRLESVPDEPRAPLPDPGGKRRDKAMTEATCQMESIFNAQVALMRMERDEIELWPDFDSESLPDIIRALAIRGVALNSALMSARLGEISTRELEGLVYRGDHPTHNDQIEIESSVSKSAKSKTGQRARKAAATA